MRHTITITKEIIYVKLKHSYYTVINATVKDVLVTRITQKQVHAPLILYTVKY